MKNKHRLLLTMHSFKIKMRRKSNKDIIDIDNFLSEHYQSVSNKFEEGFVQDIIKLFDLKLFKNESDTLGGILEESKINKSERTFDIMINGGTKGLKQYLIDENGAKKEISDKEIVGLKFFARIWLPSHSNTGYIFIQKYNSISIKPLFDELLKEVFTNSKYCLVGSRTVRTTTVKRQNAFLKSSKAKEIIVTTFDSPHDTGGPKTTLAVISLKIFSPNKKFGKEYVKRQLNNIGIKINSSFGYKIKYESNYEGYKEEKTVDDDDIINLIPNTVIPTYCIDRNNHPIFDKMREFVSAEMEQIIKESKAK